jgi:hypothetical protein
MKKTKWKRSAITMKRYSRPAERGLGPDGGAWNLKQASAWCGIGENKLRAMAKNKEIPCAYFIGRRIIVPRVGFMDWFNRSTAGSVAGLLANAGGYHPAA